MLSIRLGYGRPAFAAARCALRFCAGDKPLDLPSPLGRFFSHTAFGFLSAILIVLCHFRLHALVELPHLLASGFCWRAFLAFVLFTKPDFISYLCHSSSSLPF
jgi:hypothetical protein